MDPLRVGGVSIHFVFGFRSLPDAIAKDWVSNIHSYLALKLKDQAPIDEPTDRWLKALSDALVTK